MKITNLRYLLISLAVLLLSACTSLPSELNAKTQNVISNYSVWLDTDPNLHNEVRLGGVIATITNLKDKTRVEVVNLPIDSVGRPNIKAEPQGRFVGYVKGFLDPLTYGEGRLITLLGDTAMPETGKVGEFEHQYPVMNVSGYHLWRVEERIIINDVGPYLYPCRSFYCHERDDRNREGRVIQEVK